jgi:5-methylthioadenosine/S-adenosylhomocysteine deaminase
LKKNYFSQPVGEPDSILISNAKIALTERGPESRKSILVRDRKIVAIGERSDIVAKHGRATIEIDSENGIVIPGLINNHCHMAMSLLRGYAEDLPLLSWLKDKVWPAEARMSPSDYHLGATLSAAECLLSGTTCVTTIYFYDESGNEAEALYESGLRGTAAHGIFDWTADEGLKRTRDLVKSWHGKDGGRIRVATSPHAPYSCSPTLLKKIEAHRKELQKEYGDEYPILNTIHLSEAPTEIAEIKSKYGADASRGVAAYLRSLGVLSRDTIAAHAIHLTEDDYLSLKESGASIASCPISNLKVGMGVADLPRAMSEGITVSLGTDGPASNNSLDMFETMKIASLLQKGLKGDTTLFDSTQAFDAATIQGALSLKQSDSIGSIALGKKADIAILDASNVRSTPLYNVYGHLVFSAHAADVKDVIVDGRILVRDSRILNLDTQSLLKDVERRVAELGFIAS